MDIARFNECIRNAQNYSPIRARNDHAVKVMLPSGETMDILTIRFFPFEDDGEFRIVAGKNPRPLASIEKPDDEDAVSVTQMPNAIQWPTTM